MTTNVVTTNVVTTNVVTDFEEAGFGKVREL